MDKSITRTQIAKNIILASLAQFLSIVVSFIFGFIVPKYIDEYQYAYWQTFLMYFGYIGIIPLGLIDGFVLRYAQYDYDELNKKKIAGQFRILMIWAIIVASIVFLVSYTFSSNEYRWIAILLSLAIVVHLFYSYNSNVFQITNRIKDYAICVIIQRSIYVVSVVGILLLKINNFIWICLAEIGGELIVAIISSFKNRGLYFSRGESIKAKLQEVSQNLSAGFLLMVSNFSANFLVIGSRMAIQWRWGDLVFGQVSFSFSVSNVFLTFITAISVVLFPSLKRMNETELPELYGKIRDTLSPILFFIILLYFPGCWILEKWLPAYTESLVYLGILLPIIVFSTKVSLLTNNYLKAYRKEKVMLIINVVSVAIGFALFLMGAYAFNSLDFVLYSVVLVIMLRSIVSEIAVMKIIKKNFIFDFIVELLMTLAFILLVQFLSLWWACLAYACILIIYSVLYRKKIAAIFSQFKHLFRRHNSAKTENSGTITEVATNSVIDKDSYMEEENGIGEEDSKNMK